MIELQHLGICKVEEVIEDYLLRYQISMIEFFPEYS